jgi:hypothetical protein
VYEQPTFKEDEMENNKPAHEVRIGMIRATLWANETEHGTRYNVTPSRLYKDGEQWKDSSSFGQDDLLLLAKVLDAAHTWIVQNGG